ncbi:hypothetical protein VCD_000843 [Vibrio cholerae MJ-1236]|nr:hypothetical protein VCD_000843 [Vibrio cholerae MJ-1236]
MADLLSNRPYIYTYDLNAMVKIKVVEEGNHLY